MSIVGVKYLLGAAAWLKFFAQGRTDIHVMNRMRASPLSGECIETQANDRIR